LFPAAAHLGLLLVPLWNLQRPTLDRLDLLLFGVLVIYLAGALLSASSYRLAARYALLAVSVLGVLAALEIGIWFIAPPPQSNLPWAPMHRVLPVGDTMPGITEPSEFTANSLGVRGPEVDLASMDLRFLCVGGSTTECLYVTDRLSWPWRVQDQLAKTLGKKVFVGNAGKSGQLTPHHDYLLNHYRHVKLYDCVLLLAGYNDMGSLVLGSRSFDGQLRDAPEDTLTPGFEGRPYYRRSALLQRLAPLVRPSRPTRWRAQDPRGDWLEAERQRRRDMWKMKPLHEPSPHLSLGCAIYRASLKKIITTCRDHEQEIILLTQPTLYRKDLPEDLQRLLWMNNSIGAYSVAALAEMMDAFNQTMRDVCREEGVDCIDLAAKLPRDTTVFYDDCHFNISGCDKVARIITDFLAAKYEASKSVK
jgi:lysophospholipase L1-like esterase